MILALLGVLSTAHDITPGATRVSENVLDLQALGAKGFGPGGNQIFLDIETETAATGDAADTFEFDLAVGDAADFSGNNLSVVKVEITGYADQRLAAAGRKILTCELPDQVWQLAREGYRYLGLLSTISAGSTVSLNAAISPSRPRTPDNVQVTQSPVGLPG